MNKKQHIFEIRSLQLFILPPWPIYKMISDKKIKGRKISRIFLLSWVLIQWLLFIDIGTNKGISLLSANLAVAMFFLINLYFGLDINEFTEEERDSLYSLPLRLLVTVCSFEMMYTIPRVISKTLTIFNVMHVVHFSKGHFILGGILAITWFFFLFIDKYKLLSMFPKTEYKDGLYRLMPLTSEKLAMFYIMYFLLALFLLIYG